MVHNNTDVNCFSSSPTIALYTALRVATFWKFLQIEFFVETLQCKNVSLRILCFIPNWLG